jgi:alpha-glucoside transport system substrate-binding protein
MIVLQTKRTLRLLAAVASAALLVTACGGDDSGGGSETEGGDTETEATGGGETDGGDGGGATEGATDLEGAQVSFFGAPTSVEGDAINTVIDEYFNQPYNADAFYEGSDSFETQIKIRIDGGNPPDIALYPQPGSVIEQAEQGNAIALEDLGFEIADLEERFGSYLMSLSEYDGKHYGIPTNVNYKSLIWYNIPVFEAEGYEIPETWDELMSLSEQMLSDGYTPWVVGTGSDDATGWPATDFMEDIVLRSQGTEVYDQWVDHEIPFNDDAILDAGNRFGDIVFADGWVVGGPENIPSIDFRDAPAAIIGEEPDALMMRQASFITNFFPEGAEYETDYGAFPFPSIDGQQGALIAGELGVVFNDTPAVRQFLEVFTGEEAQCAQGSIEGVSRISPNVNTTEDCYENPVVATAAENILSALREETARFDASDLMPSEVGSGTFWTAMNEWMRGKDLEAALTDVENSWPSS